MLSELQHKLNQQYVMANPKMNQMSELRKQLDVNSGDMLRQLVQKSVQKLMAAEVDTLCGASHGVLDGER